MNPVTMHVVRPPLAHTQSQSAEPSATTSEQESNLQCFAVQSLGNTGKAFVMPTVAGAFLPPAYRFLTPLAAGLTYAHLRSNPLPLAFRPAPTREETLTGLLAGFAPFAVTYPLHTKMQGMKQFGALSAAVGDGWAHFCAQLPTAVTPHLRAYPIQFVLGRGTAQVSAALMGSVAHHEYLSWATGGRLVRRPESEYSAEGRKLMDPVTGSVAVSLFSIPAVLSTPAAVKMMSKTLSPTQQTGITVGTLIVAALGTAAASLGPDFDDSADSAGDRQERLDSLNIDQLS